MADFKKQKTEREVAAKAAEEQRKLKEVLAAKKAAEAAAKAAWLLSPAGLAARPVLEVKLYVFAGLELVRTPVLSLMRALKGYVLRLSGSS